MSEVLLSVAGVNANAAKAVYIRKLMKHVTENPGYAPEVVLKADPENPFDSGAIEVLIDRKPVGFIARKDKATAAPYLVKGECPVTVDSWGTGSKGSLYIFIHLKRGL